MQRLRAEQVVLQSKMEQEIKTLPQDASEREKSFPREIQDLKIKLHEQTSTNVDTTTHG